MRYVILFLSCILVIACSNQREEELDYDEPSEEASKQNAELYEEVASNLNEPWEIVYHNEVFYISERDGYIVSIKDGSQIRKPVHLKKDLSNQSEAGLLGIAFPSDFTDIAYAYYSYQEESDFFQRVVEIKDQGDYWEETEVLLDKIPGGNYHQGGRIEIGPDEKLYITTGDATIPELAQDLESLAGKILRMNVDGTVPTDNPFDDSYVYSFGHRNPQGLAWVGDQLYATEHGSSAHDELNKIERGHNYGWPIIQGDENQEGMETPLIHSGNETWAPSGMTYYNENLYFASLRGEGLRKANLDTLEVSLVVSDVGRIRDVLANENGIYFITNNTDGRGNPIEGDDRLYYIAANKLD
ncbi:PQQ-dependent sugar dehydrogenase [Ornithinibacillus salinisoli]|uniref:PQQ-dependent sugar dehydrogenase n=1 Tax=Ornithinibacillus salinisoli TaxID=1848459 RepID=A0ABW4W5M7_9BACI